MTASAALADTSLFIGQEQDRLPKAAMPTYLSGSTVTIGDLKVRRLAATTIAHQLPIATQKSDYRDIPGLRVIAV